MNEIECLICGQKFSKNISLTTHLKKEHQITTEQYSIQFNLFTSSCIICGKPSIFRNLTQGYTQTCGNLECRKECAKRTKISKYGGIGFQLQTHQQRNKEIMLEKFGVEFYNQSDEFKQKRLNSLKEHYGENITSPMHVDEIKQIQMENNKITLLHKYNVDHNMKIPSVKKQAHINLIKTNNIKYGVNYPLQNKELLKQANKSSQTQEAKEKTVLTYIKNWGVTHPMKNIEFKNNFFANLKQGYIIKQYPTIFNNILTYQSLLELSFIKLCEQRNIFIEDGKNIPYLFNNSIHTYFVDFQILQQNKYRLIEMKGKHKWWYDDLKTGKANAKINAAIKYSKENNYLPYKIIFNINKVNFLNK